MLCLSRKADYALIALGHIAERPGKVVSAREVAEAYDLPQALLMNILKTLHNKGILQSIRGARGGYLLGADLGRISLYDLIGHLEGKVEAGCDHEHDHDGKSTKSGRHGAGSIQAPIQALHYKLMQFLHDVMLADLVLPGRRIDVPIEMLKAAKTPAAEAVRRSARIVREIIEV
jgi:Rrf2 family protein